MANAFSEYLPHFAATGAGSFDFGGRVVPLGGVIDRPPADGPAEAEARGRREALAEAEARFEEQRAEDLADYERRLAERDRAFAEATADVLAKHMTSGLATIETRLAEHVASALARFLDTAIRERALGELSETVAALLAAGSATRIKVAGPEALIARLRQQLASHGDLVEYVPGASAEVTVAIDDTIVETRMAAWSARIGAAGETHG